MIHTDAIGPGYSIFFPWGTYSKDITKIRLRTSFVRGENEAPLYDESPVTFSEGNGIFREGQVQKK
jgi:hypothetical protein